MYYFGSLSKNFQQIQAAASKGSKQIQASDDIISQIRAKMDEIQAKLTFDPRLNNALDKAQGAVSNLSTKLDTTKDEQTLHKLQSNYDMIDNWALLGTIALIGSIIIIKLVF